MLERLAKQQQGAGGAGPHRFYLPNCHRSGFYHPKQVRPLAKPRLPVTGRPAPGSSPLRLVARWPAQRSAAEDTVPREGALGALSLVRRSRRDFLRPCSLGLSLTFNMRGQLCLGRGASVWTSRAFLLPTKGKGCHHYTQRFLAGQIMNEIARAKTWGARTRGSAGSVDIAGY